MPFDIGPLHLVIGKLEIGSFLILLLSVSLHESAHAYVAAWCGDPTPGLQGRKTLNPLKHLDPVMSVLLPAILLFSTLPYVFGAGRPVRVSPLRMRVPDRDNALVAIAGPLMNALLALCCTLLLVAGRRNGWLANVDEPATLGELGFAWLSFGIMINGLLMVFNMIPIPPLDGSRFLAYLLPGPLKRLFYALDPVGFVILIVLLFTGSIDSILDASYRPLKLWWEDVYFQWT